MTFIVAIVSCLAVCISHIFPRSMSYFGLLCTASAALRQEQQGWVGPDKGISPASDMNTAPQNRKPPITATPMITTRQLHRSQSLSSNIPIMLRVNQYKTGVIPDQRSVRLFPCIPLPSMRNGSCHDLQVWRLLQCRL